MSFASPFIRPWTRARRRPGDAYTTVAVRNAVYRACDRAGIPRWHPNQIRHTVASKVRHLHGLEAAQVVLGHARADTTQIYAERDLARAREVVRALG